jgi:hypothetical protein
VQRNGEELYIYIFFVHDVDEFRLHYHRTILAAEQASEWGTLISNDEEIKHRTIIR